MAGTDYAVHPGEFLRDWMEEHGKTQAEVAADLGVSRKHVNQLLSGASLTPTMAAKLSLVTGISTAWWLQAESLYRADVARIAQEQELAEHVDLISANTAQFLRSEGFVTTTRKDPGALVAEVFAFFGVASVEAFKARITRPAAAFRQQFTHSIDPLSVATWLRAGEIAADDSLDEAPAYDADALRRLAPRLPSKSAGDPALYLSELADDLRSVGVILVHVPEVTGCRSHGVTRWFKGHPVIQLSGRGQTDDQYWFSLMHEIHHVLEDAHEDLILQGPAQDSDDPRERRANQFASEALVPPSAFADLKRCRNLDSIRALGRQLHVAPGILVGRLQHEGLRQHSWGNGLKARLEPRGDREA